MNNTDLITDADNALGSIVSCMNKCQALILQTDTDKEKIYYIFWKRFIIFSVNPKSGQLNL